MTTNLDKTVTTTAAVETPPPPPHSSSSSTATTPFQEIVEKGITRGCGEFIHELGSTESPLSAAEYDAAFSALTSAADSQDCDATVLDKATSSSGGISACVLVRRRGVDLMECTPERRTFSEVRVAVTGNVDSGKSTILGVLTHGILDNGRGSARLTVFRHQHEASTGRTSSISHGSLAFDSRGNVVSHTGVDKFASLSNTLTTETTKTPVITTTTNNNTTKASESNENVTDKIKKKKSEVSGGSGSVSSSSNCDKVAKLVTFVDLAGHEKYLKTTMYGMTGHQPDYAMLLVGANMGVVGMTKEHLGVAAALRIPFFIVITKVDICPPAVFRATLDQIKRVVRSLGGKHVPLIVKAASDMLTCARRFGAADPIVPVICTSSVSGLRIDLLRTFLSLLPAPPAARWDARLAAPAQVVIDTDWCVRGVGTVLSGTLTHGTISANNTSGGMLLLGPDVLGNFVPVTAKSVYVNGVPALRAYAGQSCSVALRKVARKDIREGMRLFSAEIAPPPVASYVFEAEVFVLYHSTTIAPGYEAVVHCENIRQTARLVAIDGPKRVLRTGDKARVTFRFIRYPECVTVGARLVFREGRAKGMGKIVAAVPYVPSPAEAAAAAAASGPVRSKGKGKKPRNRGGKGPGNGGGGSSGFKK